MFELFHSCDLKTDKRCILEEEVKMSKKELSYLVDSLRDFLKTFDKASMCLQISLPKHKIGIGSTKSKENIFAQ